MWERERERDREFCDGKRERKMNFCDVVVEIPTQNIQERGERKKLRNCSNGVAEIGGERREKKLIRIMGVAENWGRGKRKKKLNRNYDKRVSENWRTERKKLNRNNGYPT